MNFKTIALVLTLLTCVARLHAQDITPAASEKETLRIAAVGVQIYECKLSETKELAWAFVAPEADLFDTDGKLVGKHYAGPTWEASDGSKVVGKVKSRKNAVKTNAIPWLLLVATSTESKGIFGGLTSIQRLDTLGGSAPKDGCTAVNLGKQARVYYSAEYRYFK